jgi:hypothetical protein
MKTWDGYPADWARLSNGYAAARTELDLVNDNYSFLQRQLKLSSGAG